MANYHNVQTDPGFSIPSSRELAWSQVSSTGTNYANSITFRHSANDTRQLVMRQSYFVISLTMTSAAAGAFQKAPDSSLLNDTWRTGCLAACRCPVRAVVSAAVTALA